MPPRNEGSESEWKPRFEVVARAQGRYLWALLIVGVFYLASTPGVGLDVGENTVRLPLIGVSADRVFVWSTSLIVIPFLLLAGLGSLEALKTAAERIKANIGGRTLRGAGHGANRH